MGTTFRRIERVFAQSDELVVQGIFQAVVLLAGLVNANSGCDVCRFQDVRKVKTRGLPVRGGIANANFVRSSNALLQSMESEHRHQFANFLGHVKHVANDMFWLSSEFGAQLGILGGNADRTSIQVTLAHQYATRSHEGCGGEAEFFCAQKCSNNNITTGSQLPISLQYDATSKIVLHQYLVRLRDAQFPRDTCMFN